MTLGWTSIVAIISVGGLIALLCICKVKMKKKSNIGREEYQMPLTVPVNNHPKTIRSSIRRPPKVETYNDLGQLDVPKTIRSSIRRPPKVETHQPALPIYTTIVNVHHLPNND